MNDQSFPSVLDHFMDLVRDVEIAMMTTLSEDGSLHSRPMGTLKPARPDELWFFSCARTPKVDEIQRHPQICLTYTNPVRQRYVAASGTAEVLRDEEKAREVWTPLAKLWFPGGPADPSLRLVRVRPHHIEYWDAEARRMQLLFQAARAAFGAEAQKPAERHESIDI